MVLVSNTSSCHGDLLCQIIFKSHHVWLSNGPDTILEHTNTHGKGKLSMPFRHFMVGHKKFNQKHPDPDTDGDTRMTTIALSVLCTEELRS